MLEFTPLADKLGPFVFHLDAWFAGRARPQLVALVKVDLDKIFQVLFGRVFAFSFF